MRGVRLLILLVAIAAGLGAVAMVQSALEQARSSNEAAVAPPPAPPPPAAPKTDVLVAARELRMGESLRPQDLRWQPWPLEAVSEFFVTRDRDPRAKDEIHGVVVRRGFVSGEPLTDAKLLRLDKPGVLTALLRKGMRAMAIRISAESAAGGFILPGDYVDVVFTQEIKPSGARNSERVRVAQTLISSVRILAIDQSFEDESGRTARIGATATLELLPEQVEIVALARDSGEVSLALRGVSELISNDKREDPLPITLVDLSAGRPAEQAKEDPSIITIVRGGSKQKARIE